MTLAQSTTADLRLPEGLSLEDCVCLAKAAANGGTISVSDLAPLVTADEDPKTWATRKLRILALKGLIRRADNLDRSEPRYALTEIL